jgi:hypothetical protein
MTILCRPGGSVTFFCANILILLRTTSMPLQEQRQQQQQHRSSTVTVEYVLLDKHPETMRSAG